MLSILSDTQKAVVDTITMRLDLTNALDYVKHVGFPMKRRTYYRHKKKIEDMKLERMRFIARVVASSYYKATKDLLEAQKPKVNLSFEPEPPEKIPDVGSWD